MSAVADGVDHLLLVGVGHLFDLDVEILEREPVFAQTFLRSFESEDSVGIRRDLRDVELPVRVEQS